MNYDELLDKLNLYLNKEDVETTEEIISAYNLKRILEEELHDAREAIIGKSYQERINANRRSKIFTLKEKIHARLRKENLDVFIDKKCTGLVASVNNDTCEVTVWFDDDKFISIYRDFDSSDMYFRWDENYEFLDINFDILNEYLNVIENFAKKTGLRTHDYNKADQESIQEFSDGFLRVKLVIDQYARVILTVSIEKNLDPDDIYTRKYYGKEDLKELVNNNKDELLKKIPIEIKSLEDFVQKIIKDNLKNRKILELKGPIN